jgi:GT2 family glycosyltransferase
VSAAPAAHALAASARPGAWPALAGPTTSVVICAYTQERLAAILQAVDSARAQNAPIRDIIVIVDHNASLLDRLAALLPAGVRLMANTEEKGLSGARNTGLWAAGGDLVLFLDDDATLGPDCLPLLAAACAQAGVIGTGGSILPDWERGQPAWFPPSFLWTVGCTYEGLLAGTVRNLIGACMVVRREAFVRAGGFVSGIGRTQAGLPLGCEETEFCIRAARVAGEGRFLFLPEALAHHKVPARRARLGYLVERCYAEGLSKFAVSRLAGRADALSSERSYALRTLTRAAAGGLRDALHGDVAGLGRTGAIGLGFSAACLGYLVAQVRHAARGAGPARRDVGEARP